jgi:hypothetical protein
MARPKLLGDVAVVLGALVLVEDHQADGGTSGLALEDPGEDLHLVGLATLGGVARLTRTTTIEIGLNVRLAQLETWRTAVNDAANGGTMALAEGGDREEFSG